MTAYWKHASVVLVATALAACTSTGDSGGATGAISQSAGEQACRSALVDFHGMGDVRVVSSEPYQGGGRFVRASVLAGSSGQRELWQCIAYADGSTGELQYLGQDTSGGADDGLSGTPDQFSRMEQPCIAQAARFTGVSQGAITITDRIRTGGGPILTLSAAGTPYTCRLEDDGSVTVFSEFAN